MLARMIPSDALAPRFPVSIKGVLEVGGRIVLLRNERDEWELPGGKLEAGEDPRFVARRIVIHAAEDVGNADPRALMVAVAAAQALEMLGMPEARIPLAQAALYVATAPKSNSAVAAIDAAEAAVRGAQADRVPRHLRDASYPGSARLGHGQGYLYPHDYPEHWVAQRYLPDHLQDAEFYHPSESGYEATVAERLKRKNFTR
jgi:putative ATPase